MANRWLLAVNIAAYIGAWILLKSYGFEMGGSTGFYLDMIFWTILPYAFLASVVGVFLYVSVIKRSSEPLKAMLAIYRPVLGNPARYANGIVVLFAMICGFIGFSEMKPLIPVINPFVWDQTFMELDRTLHFGRDPWTYLAPLFGPVATQWLNYAYHAWFAVLFMFWMGAAWTLPNIVTAKPDWARQFTLAFMLTWFMGGIVLAILFSSMGPVYYDLIGAKVNPFAAQMATLYEMNITHPLPALGTQDMLREAYLNPGAGKASGISAMPSMHNATSAVFMFAAYRIHKNLGHVMAAFLVIILIGSVHLGWHYAVDGYAGIAVAALGWWLAGWILKRRPASK